MDRVFFTVPDICPVCAGPLTIEGDFLYCRSKSCPAKLSGAIHIWIERLGLLYWGDALIDALTNVEPPIVNSIADLYGLSVEQIASCCSGIKMARKCYDILHGNRSIPLELLISALNINNLGTATATDIVQAGYDDIEKILDLKVEDLLAVPNIGEITAHQIFNGFQEKRQIIIELLKVISIKKVVGGKLQGKLFCITGELSKPRKAIEKSIMEAGGIVKGTVSVTTSYLVTNDSDTTSSKMQKAKKYGVTVINEQQLLVLMGS